MRAAKAARDFQGFANDLADILGTLPCNGIADSSDYLSDAVLPLLKLISQALCSEQPKRPEAFTVLWFAGRLGVPQSIVSPLRSFFDAQCKGALHSSDPTEKTLTICPPAGQPLGQRPDSGARKVVAAAPIADGAAAGAIRSSVGAEALSDRAAAIADASLETVPPSADTLPEECADDGEDEDEGDTVAELPTTRGAPVRGSDTVNVRRHSILARRSDSSAALNTVGNAVAMPRPQVVALLRTVPLMTKFSDEDLDRVAEIVVPHRFEMGDVIVHTGQVCDGLHIITKGNCGVSELRTCGQLGEGEFFAEQALQVTGGAPSPQQVHALGDGIITLSIPRVEFEALQIKKNIARRSKMMKNVRDAGDSQSVSRVFSQEPGVCEHCGHIKVRDYAQTARDKEQIIKAVLGNAALNEVMALTNEQCQLMADAVHLVVVKAGTPVFNKGDVGTAFFIVHDGFLNIKLDFVPTGDIQLRQGDTFGEFALMYDEPRAATVEALVDSKLWVMPRQAFRAVCQMSAKRRLREIADLLQKIPALSKSVDASHFELLAGVVEETVFLAGDEVCCEGQDAGTLFVVYDGRCQVTGQGEELDGRIMKVGEWVGEEQLLNESPAVTTVTVRSEMAKILILAYDSWQIAVEATKGLKKQHTVLGPLTALDEQPQLKINTNEAVDTGTAKFRKQVHGVLNRIKAVSVFSPRIEVKDTTSVDTTSVDTLQSCDVVGPLGEGSFGLVLLLRNSQTRQEYALKGISKEHLRQENQEDMVKNERNLMSLVDSSFVVRLYGAFEDPEFIYLLLEPAMGGELFDVYTDQSLWGDLDHARFYIASVAVGLSHLHSKWVVWRDLKLENCLLDSRGFLKLTDMGIAKQVIGVTYTICGTADYFAPETLRQLGHNRAADWWACGVLLFIMIAGRSPFDAPQVKDIYRNIIKGMSKVEFPQACPECGKDVILGLCKKKPQERVPMQKGGINNLMGMRFFDELSWEDLQAQSVQPPFVPKSFDYEKVGKKTLSREMAINWKEMAVWDVQAPEAVSGTLPADEVGAPS